jgi:hypothetical protein
MLTTMDNEIPLALAAQGAGLSWSQAWRLVLRGELEGRKVRGRWVVRRASLEKWLRDQACAAGPRDGR